ncbi:MULTISPECIES: hypothetical protein [unclassified Streptomyces]|uniref:hypothetical protein n=1 Tax=unclassified Streptomyces TaxID=2593676 RepID=UPI002366462D|nr:MULTISPECIES: hypothetical protein [unclassified Streptomyces]MDF3141806.1 hypothetical protein [Streptomyces sp. T21Q-yed]WDF45095.1 hypothetical protein PBV52_51260 [Streptomyces sp. T12]
MTAELNSTPDKKVRVTVDLPPADHQALKRWCNTAALDLDLTRVALAQVLGALAAELTADPADRLVGLDDRLRARLTGVDDPEVAFTTAIPKSLQQQLKLASVVHNTTIKAAVTDAVRMWLAQHPLRQQSVLDAALELAARGLGDDLAGEGDTLKP